MAVYFIQATDGGPIKIGATSHLKERLAALSRRAAGQRLRILATLKGHIPEEKKVHRRFAHLRGWGEWFEPGEDLLQFIADYGTPWDGQDEPVARCMKVWLDPHVADSCEAMAYYRGKTVGEYISETIREIAERECKIEGRLFWKRHMEEQGLDPRGNPL